MLRRISHLGLAVKDLDSAIRLYEGVFGLKVEHRWVAEADRMEAASFKVGALEIELGAHVVLIDGLITDCGRIVREGKEQMGWFDLSTLKEPYRVEGPE